MDLPIYLPTEKVFVQTFFWKNYCWRIPYLPTIWTYVQNFVVFFGAFPKMLYNHFPPPGQEDSQLKPNVWSN